MSGPESQSEEEAKSMDNAASSSEQSLSDPHGTGEATETSDKSTALLSQQHVPHLLSAVLNNQSIETSPQSNNIGSPMLFDCLLGVGLLFIVAGFVVRILDMYIVHSASQYISEQRYDKAIFVLKSTSIPAFFPGPDSEARELLEKALYLDAVEKIESNTGVDTALQELSEICPKSKYFELAQETINENTEPSSMMLQGSAETTERASGKEEAKKTLLETALETGSTK